MFFESIIIILLIAINGFFVAAEFAIVKVRATQIETLLESNLRKARIAKEVISHLDTYLSASQLGITMASIALGWVGEPVISAIVEPMIHWIGVTNPQFIHASSFALGFTVITFLHITIGEQAPKYVAIQHPAAATMTVAIPLKAFYLIFKPFIFILNFSSNMIIKLMGIDPGGGHEIAHSEAEIRMLIADGRKSGVIDATEYKLIENIFDFSETTVKEILIPRTDVFALDIEQSFQDSFRSAIDSGFTRIPVYRESIDSIIGILYVKDLFKIDRSADIQLEKILRPAYFAPESISINRLMQDFLQQKVHMGVVIDEFGGTTGIVTLENILEKIVGQIQDEYDDEKRDFEALADGSFTVSTKMRIAEFNQQFQVQIPENENYETLAGFLNDAAGHIPNLAEEITYEGLVFRITKKSPKQILQVRVVRS